MAARSLRSPLIDVGADFLTALTADLRTDLVPLRPLAAVVVAGLRVLVLVCAGTVSAKAEANRMVMMRLIVD